MLTQPHGGPLSPKRPMPGSPPDGYVGAVQVTRNPVVVIDALIAAALITAELLSVLPGGRESRDVIGLVGALLVLSSVAVRTVAPLLMALASSVGLATASVAPDFVDSLWLLAAALIVAFSVGFGLRGERRTGAATLLLASTWILQSRVSDGLAEILVVPLVIIGLPLLLGVMAGRSHDQAVRLQRLAEALERERDLHAESMILAERHRIARELHDVIAHSLSIIVVQAGAVEGTLDPGSSQRAQVAAIRAVGRSALAESRRLLTTVRTPTDSAVGDRDTGAHPQPGLTDIPALVEGSAAALQVRGAAGTSSPGLGLTAYRIVQEALTNVRRHAGPTATASVTLDWSPTALVIQVEDSGAGGIARGSTDRPDDGPGHHPRISGHGLVGMRERVAMYGGTLSVGPRDDAQGWCVRAELPLAGVAA